MSKDAELLLSLETLLRTERHAALGTLSHQGLPVVSMAPFAIDPDAAQIILHISELAAHTRYLLARPQCSVMVCHSPAPNQTVHDLPRVTIGAIATQLNRDTPDWQQAKDAYLQRFPDVEFMTHFKDFHFFALKPQQLRQVAGFGAARTLELESLQTLMRKFKQ